MDDQPRKPFSPPVKARQVLRAAATGALATLGADGAPFASLVTVATTPIGEPVFLLSTLAVHTRNIERDNRASLLLVEPGGESGDPLAGARVSLVGTVVRDADSSTQRRRFLARHAEAAGYAGFADFAFYRFAIASGHLVAGFGRIVDLTPADLLVGDGSEELIASEESAVEHMNSDHPDSMRLYATRLLGLPDGDWRTTGIDPDGIDLRAGDLRGRLEFPERLRGAGPLRATLAQLAREARERT